MGRHKGRKPPPGPPPARRRFGQNFLTDESVVARIEGAVAPRASDHLVEIGPGRGALTAALVPSGCRLDAIELDRDMSTSLLAAFSVYPGFRLHSADALRFDFGALAQQRRPGPQGPGEAEAGGDIDTGPGLRIVGNLPYNISTPLLFRLLELGPLVQDMHFMLQREVVNRLAARPGGGDWGRLGIMAQFQCEVESLFEVPPEAFEPQPKVQSAVVRLLPRATPRWPGCDRASLARVVQSAFSQRRKTLRNTLRNLLDTDSLEALGIDPAARAETLSLDQFVRLAEHCHDRDRASRVRR